MPPPLGAEGLGHPPERAMLGALKVCSPCSPAAHHNGGLEGIGGEGAEGDILLALHAVAATAHAKQVVLGRGAAVGFRDDVAALVGVPRPADDAAVMTREDDGAGGGGDGGFLGHLVSPLLLKI